jgi:hypothetical protein
MTLYSLRVLRFFLAMPLYIIGVGTTDAWASSERAAMISVVVVDLLTP